VIYKIRLDLYITPVINVFTKQTQNDNLTSDPPSALLRAGAWGEAILRTIPPPPKARAAEHADIGSLKSEALL
jgi:hypothetical protein